MRSKKSEESYRKSLLILRETNPKLRLKTKKTATYSNRKNSIWVYDDHDVVFSYVCVC